MTTMRIGTLFNPRKGQWWNAPDKERFQAYYMTMRVHYEMSALEAYTYAKKQFRLYPEFMNNPITALKEQTKRI